MAKQKGFGERLTEPTLYRCCSCKDEYAIDDMLLMHLPMGPSSRSGDLELAFYCKKCWGSQTTEQRMSTSAAFYGTWETILTPTEKKVVNRRGLTKGDFMWTVYMYAASVPSRIG